MTNKKTNKKTNDKELIVFLDMIGRTVIAKRLEETETVLTVENPVVVNIIPQQVADPNTGQQIQRMALQLFPLFFKEFLAAKDEPISFNYNKANITMSNGDIALDFKVGIQYEQLFAAVGEMTVQPAPQAPQAPQAAPQAPQAAPQAPQAPQAAPQAPEKIKLFDD